MHIKLKITPALFHGSRSSSKINFGVQKLKNLIFKIIKLFLEIILVSNQTFLTLQLKQILAIIFTI